MKHGVRVDTRLVMSMRMGFSMSLKLDTEVGFGMGIGLGLDIVLELMVDLGKCVCKMLIYFCLYIGTLIVGLRPNISNSYFHVNNILSIYENKNYYCSIPYFLDHGEREEKYTFMIKIF